MAFNSLEELLKEREKLASKQYLYFIALDRSEEEKENCKREYRLYWNSVIENYKEICDKYQEEISKLDNLITNGMYIPKEIFIPFIIECININEDENYVVRNLMLSPAVDFISTNGLPLYEHYKVIFPESLLKEENNLEKTFYISGMLFAYKDLFDNYNAKNIIVPSKGYQSLLTEKFKLIKYFEDFPYLEDIAKDIIERRIREENKSIKEILNDEIEYLKENKIKNLCK